MQARRWFHCHRRHCSGEQVLTMTEVFLKVSIQGLWYAASLARKCVNIEVEEKENHVSVGFTYKFSINHEIEVKNVYSVYPNGSVHG